MPARARTRSRGEVSGVDPAPAGCRVSRRNAEASLTPGPGSLKFDRRRMVSAEPSNRPIATMTLRIPLSTSARRTPPPSISHLMQTALENPEIVSLAAGFVDQQIAAGRDRRTARSPSCWATRSRADAPSSTGRPSATRACGPAWSRSWSARRAARRDSYKEVIPRTVVTTGSAQLIYLVCEALLDPGDIVLVESPTYFVFLGPLETRGARAIRVPIDEGGLRLDELEATLERLEAEGQLERVKLIYTIPEHANPTGISLAADRRGPLVELARRWSRKHRIFVLEDAAYRGLSFGAGEPPSRLEPRSRGRYRDPGPHVQQDLQPGAEDRLRRLTRGADRSDLVSEGEPRLRHGELQPAPAGADPRRRELSPPCGAAQRPVSPQGRGLPVGPAGVDRGRWSPRSTGLIPKGGCSSG